MRQLYQLAAFVIAPLLLHCNPCSAPHEASRIMAGQVNVVECGDLPISADHTRLAEIVNCMERAASEQQSFHATSVSPRGVSVIALGRTVAGRYETRMLGFSSETGVVDNYVCFGRPGFHGYARPEVPAYFTWTCPDENMRTEPLPPQPAYNPPSVVPVGRLCPVL